MARTALPHCHGPPTPRPHSQPLPRPPLRPQDYQFAVACARFAGGMLAAAPLPHLDVLIGGVAAMGPELRWFRVSGWWAGQARGEGAWAWAFL